MPNYKQKEGTDEAKEPVGARDIEHKGIREISVRGKGC